MRPWKQFTLIGVVFLIIIAFFPQIASTRFGKRFFLEAIQTKTHTTVTAEKIKLSWLGPQQFIQLHFDSEELKGQIDNLRVGVGLFSMPSLFEMKNIDHINGDVSLENGSFQVDSKQFPKAALTSLNGHIRLSQGSADFSFTGEAGQNSQPGSFSLQGQLKNLQSSNTQFSINGDLKSFPSLIIARILSARDLIDENLFMQILGNTLDVTGSASRGEEKGLIDLSFHTPNGAAEIHGALNHDELTITEPLVASLQLTPELSQWIMRDFNPLFMTGIQANSPIHLRIEPSSFHCHIAPFSLQDLQIGQGTLDVGQIRCANRGSIAALISFLKNDFLSSSKEISIWFTPLYFQFSNGILKTGRVDALVADTIHICTWGNIDLTTLQIDMYLGLTAETLNRSFGIKNLSDEYVLKIPLTGTTQKPNLATGTAAAKIAALLAAQKTSHSWLSGGILNILSQSDKNVPPPNRPFPWEQ